MRKFIFCTVALIMMAGAPLKAQLIYRGYSIFDSEATKQTAITTGGAVTGVLGVASIIGSTISTIQQQKIQAEEKKRFEEAKAKALVEFPKQVATADSLYAAGNYNLALQEYSQLAKQNDNFYHGLGDQTALVTRIDELNKKLDVKSSQPCVINNWKAVKQDYSGYTYDVENPVYVAKKKTNNAQIVRISCNDKETRLEFEYYNRYQAEVGLGIKGDTYIKGKKSGKLKLKSIENITISPARTMIPYGNQTLHFALIFPALNPADTEIEFKEPGTDWQFEKIVCQ